MKIKLPFQMGYVRTKTLFALALVISAATFLALQFTKKDTFAAGQAAVSPSGTASSPPPTLRSTVLRTPISPVGGVLADQEDHDYLSGLLNEAESAWRTKVPDLSRAQILTNQREIAKATVQELEDFVAQRPNSIWIPWVRNALGKHYIDRGQTTKAIEHWTAVWDMTNGLEDIKGREAAHFALAHWTRALVLLGRTDVLASVYEEVGNPPISGGLQDFWDRTLEKHIRMIKYPQHSYKCGIYALDQVAQALGNEYNRGALLNMPSQKEGYSIAELQAIAVSFQFGLTAVHRDSQIAEIPFPAVVHWRQEHYAAIVEQEGNVYKVVDPSAAGVLYLTAEEINSEATGYFLVHEITANSALVPLTELEASQVFGRASSCPPEDNEDGCEDPGTTASGGIGAGMSGSTTHSAEQNAGNCCGGSDQSDRSGAPVEDMRYATSHGMPTWHVSEPYLNLHIEDTPLFYTPSKGPSVNLNLRSKERLYSYEGGFGNRFTHPWASFIFDGSTVATVYFPGPKHLEFEFDGLYARSYRSTGLLERLVDGSNYTIGFILHYPDGGQWKYETEVGGDFFLSKVVAPDGYGLTIARNSSDPQLVETITDADNGVTTFHYEHSNRSRVRHQAS